MEQVVREVINTTRYQNKQRERFRLRDNDDNYDEFSNLLNILRVKHEECYWPTTFRKKGNIFVYRHVKIYKEKLSSYVIEFLEKNFAHNYKNPSHFCICIFIREVPFKNYNFHMFYSIPYFVQYIPFEN